MQMPILVFSTTGTGSFGGLNQKPPLNTHPRDS